MDRFTRIIASSVVILLIGGTATWYHKTVQTIQTYTIGLVWVPTNAAHHEIGHTLMSTMQEDKRFIFKEFSAPSTSDVITLNAICDQALDSNVDLLVSIGFSCTRILTQLSKKRISHTPIIFTAINKTVALDLDIINSTDKPKMNITGIYDAGLYEDGGHPISLFLAIRPKTKSILIPYIIAADSNEPYVYQAQKIATHYGATVTPLPIDKIENTMPFITQAIAHHDAIMYLEADRLSMYGANIGKLASQHGVTLFACTPDAKDAAAFTYCVEFKYIAQATYNLINKILINTETPANIPAEALTNSRILIINVNRCYEQGIPNIDPFRIIQTIKGKPQFTALYNRMQINTM